MNASEGYALFQEHGISATSHDTLTPEQIMEVLGAQVGRLFRLIGHAANSTERIFLKIQAANEEGLDIVEAGRKPEDAFRDTYTVAAEPPPHITTPHGDCLFDLVRIDIE